MGKMQLKRELSTMDREQLTQIILDLYSARKDARLYFDFFIDPDVKKLKDTHMDKLSKELKRMKHGFSGARITVVRRLIKEFASFDPGAEHVRDFMLSVLATIIMHEQFVDYTETFDNGVSRLVQEIVDFADKHALFDSTFRKLHEMYHDTKLGRKSYRQWILSEFALSK